MTFETKQAYSEVYIVLQNMPSEYIKKIPEKLINLFEKEKLNNYEINIDKNNPIDKNRLTRKTMAILAMLNYQYWCPNKKVKNNLYEQYLSNNEKYEKEIEEKYNVDNLFKYRQKSIQGKYIEEKAMAMVEYKQTFFTKLFNKIKSLFQKHK